jgi:hypothetical protein
LKLVLVRLKFGLKNIIIYGWRAVDKF